MTRRYWPIALALAALLVLGSYLWFTRLLFREISAQAAINSRIFSQVQKGLLSEEAELALFEIQGLLRSLDLPMVAFNADGEPYAASIPGEPYDPADPADRRAIAAIAADIERRLPGNSVQVPGAGRVVFGEPALLRWLRWIPALQVTGAVMLLLIAFAIVRADLRAERERLWAAMARELAHQMGTPLSSLAGWIEVLGLPAEERGSVVTDAHIAEVIGADVDPELAYEGARQCAISLLAQAKAELGELDRITRVVRLGGFVNCPPDFTAIPQVINGASDLMVEVFGDAGKHARAAVGCPSLPMGVTVEVDAVFQID